jgi:hypothetical protein
MNLAKHFTEAEMPSIPGNVSRCYSGAMNQDERMKSANELLELFTRQAELEKAMRRPGGARVTEERELLAVRRKLAKLPEGPATAAAVMVPPGTKKSDCEIDR